MNSKQNVAIRQTLNIDCIIQILGVLTINRHNDLIPQIATSLCHNFFFYYRIRRRLSLFKNILRKSLRQLMLANDR
ncbi:hypothetical protein D3C81_1447220 [compost metagenome]